MKKGNKTKKLIVINALLQGKPLRLNEITEIVSNELHAKLKVTDLSNILSILSNPGACHFGYFLRKHKEGRFFRYSLVDEFLKVPEEKAYALSNKKNAYGIDQCLSEYPDLAKYVKIRRKRVLKDTNKIVKADRVLEKEAKHEESKAAINKKSKELMNTNKKSNPIGEIIRNIFSNKGISINIRVSFEFETEKEKK